MMEPAWVVASIAVGGVLVNAGIGWSAISRIEGMDTRLRAVEQHAAALQATVDGLQGGE